jgi:hypothetical protein
MLKVRVISRTGGSIIRTRCPDIGCAAIGRRLNAGEAADVATTRFPRRNLLLIPVEIGILSFGLGLYPSQAEELTSEIPKREYF